MKVAGPFALHASLAHGQQNPKDSWGIGHEFLLRFDNHSGRSSSASMSCKVFVYT